MQAAHHGVLVTGASTGIGFETTRLLVEEGYRVFAGVRNDGDYARLKEAFKERVMPLILDVTAPDEIASAISKVAEDLEGLTALSLINNAGIVVPGPVEFLAPEEWQRQFDVNVFGVIRLTQAMLPWIRRVGQGRVVMVSSIAGRAAMPFAGAYSASKFALESLSDSLRIELAPSGIRVVLIEPGVISTPIWEKSLGQAKQLEDSVPAQAEKYYGHAFQTLLKMTRGYDTNGLPPQAVARAIVGALGSKSPRNRLVVGRDARIRLLAKLLPSEWLDYIILRVLNHHG